MPKFEKKYVHFMWTDELEGKEVFYADDIDVLKLDVESNEDKVFVVFSGYESSPFKVIDDDVNPEYMWKFVYYDPFYDIKIAQEQGKVIQYRRDLSWEWEYVYDLERTLENYPDYEYRIKPEEESKPVTSREFSKWLVQGYGEWTRDGSSMVYIDATYDKGKENETISSEIRIRKWEDTDWHKPTREYMGLEE